MKIRELVTKIGFDVDNKTLTDVDKRVSQLKTGLVGLTATIGAASLALVGLVRSSANTASNISNTASSIGVSAQSLQELGYAATLSGSNIESMAVGLRILSKNIADVAANPTSDLAKKFKQLNVNVKDNNGVLKTSDVVFKELSNSFQNITNPAERVNLAMTLLGKSGSTLIQTLGLGSSGIEKFADELRNSGGALTDAQLAQLGKFNDEWDRLFYMVGGIKNSIGAELAPVVTEIIVSIRKWFQENGKLIKSNIVPFLKGFAGFLKIILAVGMRLGDMFLRLGNMIGGVETITKYLLTAMSILFGALTLIGITKLTLGFVKLGYAMMMALAPALLVAAKIALVIGGLFLVFEDLFTFFTGGDSVTGAIVDAFKYAFGYVRDIFYDWIVYPIQNFFGRIGSFLPEKHADRIAAMMNKKGVIADITPQSRPIQSAINNANSNVSVNAPISVTVPAGTDPSMVGERVENGLSAAINDMFGQAQRFTGPPLRY